MHPLPQILRWSSNPHVGLNGQAGFQQPVRVELLSYSTVKINPHRHALHNLYVVSSCVFRGQEAEDRSCTSANVGDVRLPAAAISIQLDFDSLPRAHVGELGLLEVRGDPDI